MPTTVIKSIGSGAGRDYATLLDFWSAIPTDLVAVDQAWIGEMYKDSNFTLAGTNSFGSKTTDATRNITLRPASGQGFLDSSDILTSAYTFNASRGVTFTGAAGTNGTLLSFTQDNLTITGVQVQNTSAGSSSKAIFVSGANSLVDNCIIISSGTGQFSEAVVLNKSTLQSSLIIILGATSRGVSFSSDNGFAENVTVVRPSNIARSGLAFRGSSSGYTVRNCAAFNVDFGATTAANRSNNASDSVISSGTDNKENLVFADQVVDTIGDFRTKLGSALINAGGTLFATNTKSPTGARSQGLGPDIGAWEYRQTATQIAASSTDGYVGTPNRIFVSLNGAITSPLTVTFSGAGGTFSSNTLTIPTSATSGFVDFTPTSTGTKTITITNNQSLVNPEPVVFSVASIGLSMSVTTGYTNQVTTVNVSVSGTMNQTAIVTPSAVGGGTFSPATLTLSPSVTSGVFQYTPTTAGVKTVSLSNSGTLQNPDPETFTVDDAPRVRVPNPTPSSQGLRVVSIGAGKDYTTLTDFISYLGGLDLIAANEILLAEVYDDIVVSASRTIGTPLMGQDIERYCIVRPVRGCSEAEMNPTGAFNYGVDGIQISVTSGTLKVSRGVVLEGFRINLQGTGRLQVSSPNPNGSVPPNGKQEISRNLIKVATTESSFFSAGEYNVRGVFTDNLVIRESGTAECAGSRVDCLRNTFVARSGAEGHFVRAVGSTCVTRDNVFINVGPVPYSLSSVSATVSNNYTNQSLTSATPGFVANTTQAFVNNVVNDFSIASGSPLIAGASQFAVSVNDQRKRNRGVTPDVGALQRTAAVALPTGTAQGTSVVNGQSLVINFSTVNVPTEAVAILSAADTDTGTARLNTGVVELGTGTGTATFTGIYPGIYRTDITISNTGGSSNIIGLTPVSVVEIDGSPQAEGSAVVPVSQVPSKPVSVTATAVLGGVQLTGVIASNGGSVITTYAATASTGQFASSSSLPVFVAMPDNTPATFTLTAINSIGPSEASDPTGEVTSIPVPVVSVPDAPTITATVGVSRIFVEVTPPVFDGNSPIIAYTVSLSTAGAKTQASTSFVFDNLGTAPQSVVAYATNEVGDSVDSNTVENLVPIAPFIPEVSFNLKSPESGDISQGTSLKAAWFDQDTPEDFTDPAWQGTVVVGLGGLVNILLTGSNLLSGEIGWLVLTDSDGNPNAVHKAFSGPVVVI